MGTRLRPLTDALPKPLVPIFQKPLITFALDHLIDAGVKSFVINTHRLPELFTAFFAGNTYAEHPITLVHEPDLLETGGGIKNAEPLLASELFLTYSGDVLTDVDLRPLLDEHFRRGNDVTLALRETGLGADIAFADGKVVDIANRLGIAGRYDFANIAVWSPTVFRRIPPAQKISFIPVVTEWIKENGRIGGVVLNDGKWFNVGSVRQYLDLHRTLPAPPPPPPHPPPPAPPPPPPTPPPAPPTAHHRTTPPPHSLPTRRSSDLISFIPVVTEWIKENGRIGGVVLNDGKWFNVGSVRQYLDLHRTLAAEKWKPHYVRTPEWPLAVAKNARVHPTAQVLGCSVVVENCCVDSESRLVDRILWSGSQIASRSVLENCIVRTHRTAAGTLHDAIV